MKININHAFIKGMAVATLLAAGSVGLHLPVGWVLIFELAPLVWYFSRLYKAGSDGLSHSAIDSVYYFGFIITIMALAGSVFRVWLYGIEKDISGLIAQFGVGLLATGLALVFRLVLTARVESLNAKDLTQTIEEYVSRINGVVSKIEASAASFEGLSNSLQDRTRAVVQSTFEECTASMRAATAIFSESITQISSQTSQSVTKFSEIVHSVAVSDHVQQFDSNVVQLTTGLKGFAEQVATYGKTTTDEALKATRNALNVSTRLHSDALAAITTDASAGLGKSLQVISQLDLGVDTTMVKTDLANLSRAITSFTKRFAELDDKLTEVQARNNAEAILPIVDGFAEEMRRVTDLVGSRALAQLNDTSQAITSEIAKGVVSVRDATAADNARRADEFSAQISTLIAQLERAVALTTQIQSPQKQIDGIHSTVVTSLAVELDNINVPAQTN
jgi:hypothetical protein